MTDHESIGVVLKAAFIRYLTTSPHRTNTLEAQAWYATAFINLMMRLKEDHPDEIGCFWVNCNESNNPLSVVQKGDLGLKVMWQEPGRGPDKPKYIWNAPECGAFHVPRVEEPTTLRSLNEYEGLTVEQARRRAPVNVRVVAKTITQSAPSSQNVVTVIADERGIVHYAVAGCLISEN